jgi:hypothetical protein
MADILIKAFDALWQVLLAGLILGAGLPALFALGMRSMAANRPVAPDGVTFTTPPTGAGRAGAYVCFGLCALAVLFGIVVIIFGSQLFGK